MGKKYREISSGLIDKSFPLLKGRKISLFVIWLRFYAFSVWIPPFLRVIAMSTRTKGFNDSVITGILAHELCHQERYLKMGARKYLAFALRFLISRKARAEEERNTDRLTIEKGYGKELYELTLITHTDRNHDNIKDLYLTPEEIKVYSISLGNWKEQEESKNSAGTL